MDDGNAVVNVAYTASASGAKPVGLLLNDVKQGNDLDQTAY